MTEEMVTDSSGSRSYRGQINNGAWELALGMLSLSHGPSVFKWVKACFFLFIILL